MKKYISIITILLITSFLAYKIDWFSYILILSICLSLLFLLIVDLIAIFKHLSNSLIRIPFLIIGICVIAILISFFRPYEDAIIRTENMSENLEHAYNTDQNDRKEIRSFIGFFSKLEDRDQLRLAQARTYYSEDKISKPIDKFHAAFIFHHSNNSKRL